MQVFSVIAGKAKTEFSINSIHDIRRGKLFQALINGRVITEGSDYEEVRDALMDNLVCNAITTSTTN